MVGRGMGVASEDAWAGFAVANCGGADGAEEEDADAGSGAGAEGAGTGRCAAAASNVLLMRDHPERDESVDC